MTAARPLTTDELEDLVGIEQAAKILRLTPSGVSKLVWRGPPLPDPAGPAVPARGRR